MNQSEIATIIFDNINSPLEGFGFKKRKVAGYIACYEKKFSNGIGRVFVASQNDNYSTRLAITFERAFSAVEELMVAMANEVKMIQKVNSGDATILFTGKLNGHDSEVIPDFFDTVSCLNSVKIAANKIIEYGIPQINRWGDLVEIDSIINGNILWGPSNDIPFTIYRNFFVKRLIIAKLAQSQRFEEIVEGNFQIFESILKQDGTFDTVFPRRKEHPIGYAVNYLRSF